MAKIELGPGKITAFDRSSGEEIFCGDVFNRNDALAYYTCAGVDAAISSADTAVSWNTQFIPAHGEATVYCNTKADTDYVIAKGVKDATVDISSDISGLKRKLEELAAFVGYSGEQVKVKSGYRGWHCRRSDFKTLRRR